MNVFILCSGFELQIMKLRLDGIDNKVAPTSE